jgi:hypothetical protein
MRVVGLVFVALSLALATCRTYDTIYTDDGGGKCVLPNIECNGGVCVDPTSDRLNCGGCGNSCKANELCANNGSGAGCVACPTLQIACGTSGAAFCTDTTSDSRNCGGCGVSCSTGLVCQNSTCACPLTTCNSACVDTTTDVNNCGGCNVVCPSGGPHEGAVCTQSHCSIVCAPFFADCDGVGTNGCEANLQSGTTSCGACFRSCAGAAACTGGMCATTKYANGFTQLGGTAVDTSFVYWGDRSSTGSIRRAPVSGGTAQTYFADNASTLLFSNATRLVWLDVNTTIQSRLLSGGSVTSLVTTSGILAMFVDSGFAYYGTSAGVVARVPVDGSSGTTTITSVTSPRAIVADGATVWIASVNGDIVTAPASAQNVIATPFATSALTEVLALDATSIYWLTSSGDVIAHAKSTSTQSTLATKQDIATNLVTDGTLLFWGANDGSIRELPVTGGKPLVIASGETQVASLAIDATTVYWTTPDHVSSTSK